jgi:site-specific DNA-cytosine methylase
MRNVRWANIIPLVGGSALGCYSATGTKPLYNLSYSAFNKNEEPLEKYWEDVPRINLDENKSIPETKVDFINTVCPCAGLSLLSTAKSKEVRDKSNKWMLESADIVLGKIKPRVFWGENAPGLFTNMGGWVREILIEKAKKYGYSFSLYRTTTSKHGIPQNRLRTFYFFWDSPTPPILNYYDRPLKSFGEYLEEIPGWASSQNEFQWDGDIGNNSRTYLFILDKLKMSHREFIEVHGDGGAVHSVQTFVVANEMLDECIAWVESKYGESKESNRLKRIREKVKAGGRFMDGSPAYYKSTCNALVGRNLVYITHPYKPRYLSTREIVHMMGMPHDFEFSLEKYNMNLLAQNVPSCTARDMTLEVLKFLNNELEFHENDFLKQDNIKQRIIEK